MNIVPGNGIVLIVPRFINGNPNIYPRPFLVIDADSAQNTVSLLGVSSIKGKEHKLLYPSSIPLKAFNPPFDVPSYAKMHELYVCEYFKGLGVMVSPSGTLNVTELQSIIDKFNIFKNENTVPQALFTEAELRKANPKLLGV
jgi:hypothetical protein